MNKSQQKPLTVGPGIARARRLPLLVSAIVAVAILLLFAGSGSITAESNGRVTNGLIALYNFEQGATANTVYDVSGYGAALDLTISGGSTDWISGGGLAINNSATIASTGPASKIIDAAHNSGSLSIEVWLAPANVTQDGPARIVSISDSSLTRNVTLGQGLWGKKPKTVYDVRLRTSQSDDNGQPSLTTAEGTAGARMQHVVMTYSSGQRKIYVDNAPVAADPQTGNLNNWDESYQLLLANEADGSRPWLGELHLVAFYDRALSTSEIAQNFATGPHPGSSQPATPTDTPDTPTETPTVSAESPTSTATPTNTPVPPTETPTETAAAPTATSEPGNGMTVIYVSSSSGGSAGGVRFADEDVLRYDTAAGTWSLFLDGSDIGLSGSGARDIDAFHLFEDNSILFSVTAATSLPDVGSVDDSDIIRFVPTSTGSNTAGSFSLYFDGSDVELTADGEDIDSITVLGDGDLLFSTSGGWKAGGFSGADEDLLRFSPSSLGDNTSGSWSLYLDGSDVGLANSASEDMWGAWLDNDSGALYLTPKGAFSVNGASGKGEDILKCQPSALGESTECAFELFWDGSINGIGGEYLDGLSLRVEEGGANPTPAPTATAEPTNTPKPSTPTPTPVSGGGGKTEMLVYDWNGLVTQQEKGFPRHTPPTENGDWTQPVNFANGTFYMRVEIRSQPKAQDMRLQYCVWQDKNALETCTKLASVSGAKGTIVTWSHAIDKMWKKGGNPIDWTRGRFKDGVAIKNSKGQPVSPFQNWNWNG
ncbi:MAG: LamG domain-containing protein, partial [Caldilineaceae bacterium]